MTSIQKIALHKVIKALAENDLTKAQNIIKSVYHEGWDNGYMKAIENVRVREQELRLENVELKKSLEWSSEA